MKKSIYGATAAIALLAAGAASAATVNVASYGTVAAAVAAQNSFIGGATVVGTEDFEGLTGANTAGGLLTGIGTITTIAGGPGTSGSTAIAPLDQSVVRSAAAPGTGTTGFRYDADDTPGSTNYLDSNDNAAINIAVAGIGMFDRISFMLTDIDDVGAILFKLFVGGNEVYATPLDVSKPDQNGRLLLATIDLGFLTDTLNIEMSIDAGDGFGFDGAKIAATPLPAPALMLLGGLGALGVAARRKRKAA
jgi:hypothetical protein